MDSEYRANLMSRIESGEHARAIERAELEDDLNHERQIRESVAKDIEGHRRERENSLTKFAPPESVVQKALELNKTPDFSLSEMRQWLSEIAKGAGPDRPHPRHLDGQAKVLERARTALLELYAALHDLDQSRRRDVHHNYRSEIVRSVRGIERRYPSWYGKVQVSFKAGMFAWSFEQQLGWLYQALGNAGESVKSALRRGRPTTEWKKRVAFEVAFALYCARSAAKKNAPEPNGRDGSNRAVAYLLLQLLNGFCSDNLSDATLEAQAAFGITCVRKLVAAGFDDCNVEDPHGAIIGESCVSFLRVAEGGKCAPDLEKWREEHSPNPRELRAADLNQRFCERIGLYLAASPP